MTCKPRFEPQLGRGFFFGQFVTPANLTARAFSYGCKKAALANKEELSMSKLLAITVALGLVLASATPGLAADKAPNTKSACEKAHMKWDDSSKTCSKGGY